MPRAKANPDPMLVEHTRADLPGVVFVIEAFRDGGYNVMRGEKVVFTRASQLGAFFGASQYPSNRMQALAIEDAKALIGAARHDSML